MSDRTPVNGSRPEYSDKYFVRAADILIADDHNPEVLMQIFCRSEGVLCGVNEAVSLFDHVRERLTICTLEDGDSIAPWETIMTISGAYRDFAPLETQCLGVLARGTRVATQTRAVVEAAGGKPVLFFGGRHDHYLVQKTDGYAAILGGAVGVATDAQGARSGYPGVGTIPHALIAAYGGDTVLASKKFVQHMPEDIPFVALVDFDNDCAGTSVAVARALGDRLSGVRLDTASALVDLSLVDSDPPLKGVNPSLVDCVRRALDEAGFPHVEIVVSGGMNATRIAEFETCDAQVDAYGVGSSILHNGGEFDFTADIVRAQGKAVSKEGRSYRPNDRLKPA